MKLSTRTRYGTRLMLDMAQHYGNGPLHLATVASRQGISVKYLEQIIIPLKRANYVKSVRGPKGGHVLAKAPHEITVGEIVALLEDGSTFVECSNHEEICGRANFCVTRQVWKEAALAMFKKLHTITLADLVEQADSPAEGEGVS